MEPVQARQLQGLIGFAFQRPPKLNLPEERLTAIERHVQKRVRQLLQLTPVRKKIKNALGRSGDTQSSATPSPGVAPLCNYLGALMDMSIDFSFQDFITLDLYIHTCFPVFWCTFCKFIASIIQV